MSAPRINPTPPEQWTEEQRARCIPIGDKTKAWNVLGTFVQHYDAFVAMNGFGKHNMGPTSTLSPRVREFIILRVGLLMPCEYEWAQHKLQAKWFDIKDEEIERVKLGGAAPEWTAEESVLLDITDDLIKTHGISDAVWARAISILETKQIFDGIYLVGQYITVALIANSVNLQIEKGLGLTGFDPNKEI